MTALPAKSSTLKAHLIVTPAALKDPDTFGAAFAEVTRVELKPPLHELLLPAQKVIDLLEVLVGPVYLPHSLEELIHFHGTLGLKFHQGSFLGFDGLRLLLQSGFHFTTF